MVRSLFDGTLLEDDLNRLSF